MRITLYVYVCMWRCLPVGFKGSRIGLLMREKSNLMATQNYLNDLICCINVLYFYELRLNQAD